MRITTGMLNRNHGSGLIGSRKSLLSYVQQTKAGGSARLSAMGAAGRKNALKRTEKAEYEKLGTAADSLTDRASRLADKVDKGGTEVTAQVESLLDAYNNAVEKVGAASGVLNNYYHQMLKQTFSDNREALAEIGITMGANGNLTLDKEKLEKADGEKLKKLLGSEGDFSKRAGYVASRISDNAQANVRNLTSYYNSAGDITNSYLSRYNMRG